MNDDTITLTRAELAALLEQAAAEALDAVGADLERQQRRREAGRAWMREKRASDAAFDAKCRERTREYQRRPEYRERKNARRRKGAARSRERAPRNMARERELRRERVKDPEYRERKNARNRAYMNRWYHANNEEIKAERRRAWAAMSPEKRERVRAQRKAAYARKKAEREALAANEGNMK